MARAYVVRRPVINSYLVRERDRLAQLRIQRNAREMFRRQRRQPLAEFLQRQAVAFQLRLADVLDLINIWFVFHWLLR